jgi:hypothetical protein
MEVDALQWQSGKGDKGKHGKGKGDKGKSKGKHGKGDKGKTKSNGKYDKGKHKSKSSSSSHSTYFDGACNFCQKWGHKAADCRANPKNGTSGKCSIHHVAEQVEDSQKSTSQQQEGNKKDKNIGSGKGTVSAMYVEQVPESRWVMSLEFEHEVSAMSSFNNDSALMLIDSGSAIMACPPSLATKYSMVEKSGKQLRLKGVNGSIVQHYGTAVLKGSLETYCNDEFAEVQVDLNMEVADVSQMIASISSLAKRGFSCYFPASGNGQAFLEKGGRKSYFIEKNGLYCPS